MNRTGALVAASALLAYGQSPHDPVADLTLGKRIFDSQCAVCHGEGGTGGRGPALTKPKLVKAPDEEALRKAIFSGLPPEMPAAWQLSVREVASVAGYVRSLGKVAPEKLPGDAVRGGAVYAAKGCAGCHIMNGAGNGQGPELTAVGARRNAANLRQSLLNPDAELPLGYQLLMITTVAGARIRGARVAEDPFTIQIRDASGRLHSFHKQDVQSVQRSEGRSGMPAFSNLTPAELDDLVAFLASRKGDAE